MEKRLLLNRVTLQCSHISMWHAQLTALIEPHLTDPALPITDHAATLRHCKPARANNFQPCLSHESPDAAQPVRATNLQCHSSHPTLMRFDDPLHTAPVDGS